MKVSDDRIGEFLRLLHHNTESREEFYTLLADIFVKAFACKTASALHVDHIEFDSKQGLHITHGMLEAIFNKIRHEVPPSIRQLLATLDKKNE